MSKPSHHSHMMRRSARNLRLFTASAALLAACLSLSAQTPAPQPGGAPQPPAPPVLSPDHPENLQAAIRYAIKYKAAELVIPPGVYRLPPLPTGGGPDAWHIVVENASDLAIKAEGVTLVFTDRFRSGITFQKCTNVSFSGATLKKEAVTFTQGRVEAISADGSQIDVRIAAGYPTDLNDPKAFEHAWLLFFDPATRIWKTELRAATTKDAQQIEPGLFRIKTENIASTPVKVSVGDLVALRGAVYTDLRAFECGGMKFTDIAVRGGSGFCFQDSGGEGNNLYERCSISYRDMPEGAKDAPLLAANADGLHSADARIGPKVIDCRFEGLNDDAIAIHGTYAMVLEANENRIIAYRVPMTRSKMIGRPGDKLHFYNENLALAGEAVITGVKALTDYQNTYDPGNRYSAFRPRKNAGYIELTLDRAVPAKRQWLLANQNDCGGDFIVRNAQIRDTSARGVYAQAPGGLIEGCTIQNTGRAAVEFNTETGIWSQADYSSNVIVRNNTFRSVATNRRPGLLRHAGAVTILAFNGRTYIPRPGGHRNIVIENNRFEDIDGLNILVCSAQDITIRGNQFINPMRNEKTFGVEKGVDPTSLIWINESSDVKLADNVVTNPGPFLKRLVGLSATGSGSGVETGVVIAGDPAKAP